MGENKIARKVEEIYDKVANQPSDHKVLRHTELVLYTELTNAICSQLKYMRTQLLEGMEAQRKLIRAKEGVREDTDVQPVIKAYPLILLCSNLGGFQRWNAHYAKDQNMQFTDEESNYILQAIQDFFSDPARELPKWIGKLCTLLAMRAALEESAIDARFNDAEPLQYLDLLYHAFMAIMPYINSHDIEPIFQQFTLTYPLSVNTEFERGSSRDTRIGERYYLKRLYWKAKNQKKDD